MTGLGDSRQGEASGAYNTLRELGGVFGVAALGAIFQAIVHLPAEFVSGFHAALQAAGVILLAGAGASFLLPGRYRARLTAAENQGSGRADARGSSDPFASGEKEPESVA